MECVCPRRVGSQESARFSQAAFQPERKENENKKNKNKCPALEIIPPL